MRTATFWVLLIRHGEAKLLAPAIIFMARVKPNQVGRYGLDVRVKYNDILRPIQIASNDLI